jgi:ABC-2 type transport system ATP-binding protein
VVRFPHPINYTRSTPLPLALETRSLTKRFRRVEALHSLSLQIPEGAVYALMGPNGAGKTTLIKLLMNLLRPTVGDAFLLGEPASQLRGQRLESIGYVSENQKLPDWMSVETFLAYLRPFYPRWDRALELRLLRQFDLPPKARLKRLSRGMRMKASLIAALAHHPRLLILDEPLSGLDPLVRDDLMAGISALAGESTVLFSSHDLAEIENFSSHVAYLDRGRLQLAEPMANVRQRFRRLTAIAAQPIPAPANIPATWQQFTAPGPTATPFQATWLETTYDPTTSPAQARELLGPLDHLDATPLTLREVFLTLARSTRPSEGAPS